MNDTFHDKISLTGGIEAKMIEILANTLKFKYELVTPKDGQWGKMQENGSWTGLIGMVSRNESDLALAYITATEQRKSAVDFITYTTEETTFLTNALQFPTLSMSSYLYPFDVNIWGPCIAAFIIMAVVSRFTMKKHITFTNLIFSILGCFFKQGITLKIKTLPQVFLFGSWLLFTMIISSLYIAILPSVLTAPTYDHGIDTIQELSDAIKKGSFKCYTSSGSSDTEFLLGSKDRRLRMIGKKIVKNHWEFESEGGVLPKDLDEASAVIGPRALFELKFRGNRQKRIFKESIAVWNVGIAVNKKFYYKQRLMSVVNRIIAAGIYRKLFHDEIFNIQIRADINETSTSRSRALSIRNLSGAFILLGINYAASFTVLFLENVKYFILDKDPSWRMNNCIPDSTMGPPAAERQTDFSLKVDQRSGRPFEVNDDKSHISVQEIEKG
ncbi:probable glutamate receptor [Stegodyphus dumicola]|uniref:probable glutamate receptor n=1 Tax=Stegodyphus dumicola TaxID=202533 RepID=UPI0015ABBE83|nr:probable glutamate receptor [Stegodyphus dumicola]